MSLEATFRKTRHGIFLLKQDPIPLYLKTENVNVLEDIPMKEPSLRGLRMHLSMYAHAR